MFVSQLKTTLNNDFNENRTENGAIGYKATASSLLDINFATSSLRNMKESDIIDMFEKAFYENKALAVKWLFYLRDIRGGLGERRSFRIILTHLAKIHPEIVKPLLKYVAEYGRYDDLWCLLHTQLRNDVIIHVIDQLSDDLEHMEAKKSVSLLAKWLPSINTSSKITKEYAKIIINDLKLTAVEYRKLLSTIREYIDVVEKKMSAKKWSGIDYEIVPSRANLIYNSAFLRNDEERRRGYLDKLSKGEAKINALVLFPHDIYHKYYHTLDCFDETLEALWQALPNKVKENGNTLVACDGSGSMECRIGKSNIEAIDVSNALAIYFAERSFGEFKDKFITFGARPQLVDLSKCKNLYEKINYARKFDDCSNTNIEKTFDLILQTAINGKMEQKDMPNNILIISDMEFDCCSVDFNANLFKTIEQKYKNAGYLLPRLIFWNVNSRTNTIPVKENDLGVALVSGFSVNVVDIVLSNELNPLNCLLKVLNSERYLPIECSLEEIV